MKFRRGEQVRIMSYEKIRETLDEGNCHENLLFMENMAKFCGGKYEILKEVKWLYDEYHKTMRRAKNIVVLKDLVCDGRGVLDGKDCDRCCLLLWKTAWLEKVT